MPGFEFSGKIVEHNLFGSPERMRETIDYKPYPAAMADARRLQAGDPKDPRPLFAYHVFIDTEKMLGIEGMEKLNFYTSVDTILDIKHGVDGWFELDGGARVTVDLTTNPEKVKWKADIVFQVPRGGYANEEEVKEGAARLAEEIAQRLGGKVDFTKAS